MNRPLVLDDIEDLRTYERGRDVYRRRIIELKKRRRVAVGPLHHPGLREPGTIRFQVQEMARVERMATDEQVQGELDVYNALLPTPGELSATMFIELTDEASLRSGSKLVGVERSMECRIGAVGGKIDIVPSLPEATHEEALTRPAVTASVHYIRFAFSPDQVGRFAEGPVVLAAAHPEYRYETTLSDETRAELLSDLDQ